MKNSGNSNHPNPAKNTFHYIFSITILLLLNVTFSSQAQNIWQGGTPGAETNWNNPKNWSKNRVPDWSDTYVIIPDVSSQSGQFPEVKNQVPTIASLSVEGGAKLMIRKKGNLTIDGGSTYNFGILNTGKLLNEGKITVHNTALEPLENPNNPILNKGGAIAFYGKDNVEWLASK